jgi:hypothetical protein
MTRLFLFIITLLTFSTLDAQPCIDSSFISSSYPCPNTEYYPVCGCDNKTYRNLCEAQFRHGVQRYTDGSCSGFEFDILPNFTSATLTFTLVQTTNPTYIKMVIMDAFGKIERMENVSVLNRYYATLDVSELLQGVYFIFIYDSKNNYRYRKFVKYNG